MLRPEAVKMLETFGRVLKVLVPEITYSTRGDEVVEVSLSSSDETPLLLFQVDDEVVNLRFGGNLYQNVQTVYSWETLIDLLVIYLSFVYPVYSSKLTLPQFLSAIFSVKIRNWADMLGRLMVGLDLHSEKIGDTFFIEGFSIRTTSREVILSGVLDTTREYTSPFSLCKAVLAFFSVILQSLDEEVLLWNEDSSLVFEMEPSKPASSSPITDIDINNDVPEKLSADDIPLEDVSLSSPLQEEEPSE